MPPFFLASFSDGAVGIIIIAAGEWRNGIRARLRTVFRKDWRFESSLAHHTVQIITTRLPMYAEGNIELPPPTFLTLYNPMFNNYFHMKQADHR